MTAPAETVFAHIRGQLQGWTPQIVFDVGANVGQSVIPLAKRLPKTIFHSFEPGPSAFAELVQATRRLRNVVTHNIALGREAAILDLELAARSTRNRLVPTLGEAVGTTVSVRVRSGIEVMQDLKLSRIDFLKIDTEGHDFEVLLGFLPMIREIDFIQVEASMNPHNQTHIPLARFQELLCAEGFHLYHIFEQKMEWKLGGRPVLRRSNPVFINGRLLSLEGIS